MASAVPAAGELGPDMAGEDVAEEGGEVGIQEVPETQLDEGTVATQVGVQEAPAAQLDEGTAEIQEEDHPAFAQLALGITSLEATRDRLRGVSKQASEEDAMQAVIGSAAAQGLLPEAPDGISEEDRQAMEDGHREPIERLLAELVEKVAKHPSFFGETGEELYASLEELLQRFRRGPYKMEDDFIAKDIIHRVHKVLQEVQLDDQTFLLLIDGNKGAVEGLVEDCRRLSEDLGQEHVPNRLEKEEQRTEKALELCRMYDHRAEVVNKPSAVPEQLKQHQAAVVQEAVRRRSTLERRVQYHADVAASRQRLQEEQTAFRARQSAQYQQAVDSARAAKREKDRLLQQRVERICQDLLVVREFAVDIRGLEQEIAQNATAHKLLNEVMEQASELQEQQKRWHTELKVRYQEGKDLLDGWTDWLGFAYEWLERTLLRKRDEAKQELPVELGRTQALLRQILQDLQRRMQEQVFSMQLTIDQRDKAATEAARLERIRSRAPDARIQKERKESLDRDLGELQKTHDELQKLLDLVKGRLKDDPKPAAAPRLQGGLAWVAGFFYTAQSQNEPYVPPALGNLDHLRLEDGADDGGSGTEGAGFVSSVLTVMGVGRRKRIRSKTSGSAAGSVLAEAVVDHDVQQQAPSSKRRRSDSSIAAGHASAGVAGQPSSSSSWMPAPRSPNASSCRRQALMFPAARPSEQPALANY